MNFCKYLFIITIICIVCFIGAIKHSYCNLMRRAGQFETLIFDTNILQIGFVKTRFDLQRAWCGLAGHAREGLRRSTSQVFCCRILRAGIRLGNMHAACGRRQRVDIRWRKSMTAAALTTPVLGGGGRWTHKGYFEDDEDEEEEDYSGLED